MLRTDTPISEYLTGAADPAGGALQTGFRRLTAGADYTVPAGRRSVTVTAITTPNAATPTVAGKRLAAGVSAAFASDYPGFNLPTIAVVTAPGDDVIVLETWPGTGTPPVAGNSMLLESGGALLLESGGRLLLEP